MVHTFAKGISSEVKVIARVGFELANFVVTIQHVSLYTTGNVPFSLCHIHISVSWKNISNYFIKSFLSLIFFPDPSQVPLLAYIYFLLKNKQFLETRGIPKFINSHLETDTCENMFLHLAKNKQKTKKNPKKQQIFRHIRYTYLIGRKWKQDQKIKKKNEDKKQKKKKKKKKLLRSCRLRRKAFNLGDPGQ